MATKKTIEDAAPEAAPEAPAEVESVYVVAVNADMLNLYTSVWLTKDPKKVPNDDFIKGQVAAGKLAVVEP